VTEGVICWQFYINCRATLACFACFVQSTSIRALYFRFFVRRRIFSLNGPSQSDRREVCIADRLTREMHGHNGPWLRGRGDEWCSVHARWARLYARYSPDQLS
jgi:hypothetical protein